MRRTYLLIHKINFKKEKYTNKYKAILKNIITKKEKDTFYIPRFLLYPTFFYL